MMTNLSLMIHRDDKVKIFYQRLQWLKQVIFTRSFIFILFGLMFFLRLGYLNADPPGSTFTYFPIDEGWWVHNARNKALFGQWILDDYNGMFYAPVFNYVT